MPNYVTSRCRVIGNAGDIALFKAVMIRSAPADHSDAGGLLFDFNRIIPMPAPITSTEESGLTDIGVALIIARGSSKPPFCNLGLYDHKIKSIRAEAGLDPDAHVRDVASAYLQKRPEVAEKGMASLRALVETGHTTWYTWAIANWGTKWGAFRFAELPTDDDSFLFRFETAWSFPTPVFEALASRFPCLQFECATFDEGSNFAGWGWFNPRGAGQDFALCDATDELYEMVYGHPRPCDEDE